MNGIARRVIGGLRRRGRYWKSVYWDKPRMPLAQGTLGWMLGHAVPSLLSATRADQRCGLLSQCAATLWNYGQREVADSLLARLAECQLETGAFHNTDGGQPSLLETAQVLAGLLALEPDRPELESTAIGCCHFLCSRIGGSGELQTGDISSGLLDACLPVEQHFAIVVPLARAAIRFRNAAWERLAKLAIGALRRRFQPQFWRMPLCYAATTAEALIELGWPELARALLVLPSAAQRGDGSVPVLADVRWVSSNGLAHMAAVWYRLGERERADRAMAYLYRHQRADGGFPASWGPGARTLPFQHEVSTAKHVLDAALLQVEATFAAQAPGFEESIDPLDGRLLAVRDWLALQPGIRRVADVGCGKGRFLRHLAAWFPQVQFVGIDPSQAMLQDVPDSCIARVGNLLRLPMETGSFDAAFAVESIEHALIPEQAIAELCRIVRPGGGVLVLDKNRDLQPLSEHECWEQWLTHDEGSQLLGRFCGETVSVQAVPLLGAALRHGFVPWVRSNRQLFLAWTGQRMGSADRPAQGMRHAA